MVLLTLTRKFNKTIAPFILRNGIAARYAIGGGIVNENALLDMMLMIRLGQTLISLEAHDESLRAVPGSRRIQSAMDEWAEQTFDRIFGAHEEVERQARRMKQRSVADIRVDILESYLRPALLKNEKWSDVVKWQFNNRLLKWARAEFLVAKYGPAVQQALSDYPELRLSPQLVVQPLRRGILKFIHGSSSPDTRGRVKLPHSDVVEEAFGMTHWKKTKDLQGFRKKLDRIATQIGGEIVELRGGAMRFANIPEDADISKLSLEEILEVAGGHVAFCGPFNSLAEECNIYQLWTKEYVDLLAKYLVKRAERYQGETVVLDMGAGDGLLAQYLRDAIQRCRANKGIRQKNNSRAVLSIVAVDDGSWKILHKANVTRISAEDALARYANNAQQASHVIVICSWMPMGVDWSRLFRKFKVDEYILIGEFNDGTCGDNWETWGNPSFHDSIDETELLNAMYMSNEMSTTSQRTDQEDGLPQGTLTDDKIVSQSHLPPYEEDGYKRIDIDELVPYQLSRFDSSVSRNGKTVTFRRKR